MLLVPEINSTTRYAKNSSAIVITGMAAATALGLNVGEIWDAVHRGTSGIGPMPAMEQPLPVGADGCEAVALPADFEPELPREARYLRWTILDALRDSSSNVNDEASRAVVLGTTLHGMRAAGRFFRSNDYSHLRHFLAGDTLRLACRGIQFSAGSTTTCSACASSLSSIALGITLLQTGAADQVVVGGYDTVSEYVWAGFKSLRLVADGPLRPFQVGRRGMKIGEGYAILVLEREDRARERGATIHAVVAGWAESSDAHHLTQPHPAGDGARRAMMAALDLAAVSASDLNLISAHATGTPDNDAAEYAAMASLLGDRLPEVPVATFKSHLGHTLGAAGAVELILSAMAMKMQTLPARTTADAANALEFSDLQIAPIIAEPCAIHHTINTSLGFGGANSCVTLSSTSDAHSRASRLEGVCITGIGVVLPRAVGNDAFVKLMNEPHRGETSFELADAEYEHLLNARRVRRMSTPVKLLLAAATLACRDAKLIDNLDLLADTGAILGTTHGSASFSTEYYAQIVREGMLAANPLLFAEGVPNVAAAHLSMMLGLKRGCQSIIGTRTAGLDALRFATLRIANGDSERLIVGASEERADIVERAYESCGLKACAAYDAIGFQASPGGVAMVIESESSAMRRGATVYTTVTSVDAISDAPEKLPMSIRTMLERLSQEPSEPPIDIIGSANHTWIDRAEATGLLNKNVGRIGTIAAKIGEAFSVTPLAAISAALLGAPIPTEAGEPFIADRFGCLSSDWAGAATLATFQRLANPQTGR